MRQPPQTREEWIQVVWAPLLVPFLVNCCLFQFAREWLLQINLKLVPLLVWLTAILLIGFPLPWKLSIKKAFRPSAQHRGSPNIYVLGGVGILLNVVNGLSFTSLREDNSLLLNLIHQLLCLLVSAWGIALCFKYSPQPERVEFEP